MNLLKIKFFFILLCMANTIFSQSETHYMSSEGTIFKYPETITSNDPTSFEKLSMSSLEKDIRMYDREAKDGEGNWISVEAYVFDLNYNDGLSAKVRVRKDDYTKEDDARKDAEKYAKMMGQLPRFLRGSVKFINLMKGDREWGGNSATQAIDMQIGDISKDYEARGILEETLVHESCHVYFSDTKHNAPDWVKAKKDDPLFISKYASDFPQREDFAESVVPYIALKFRRSRITVDQAKEIVQAIPNRIKYLEKEKYKMYPLTIKDVEENEYRVNKIGKQRWMAENLRTSTCNDGTTKLTTLKVADSKTSVKLNAAPSLVWHDDDENSTKSIKYGPLYNWQAVSSSSCKVCPQGWRIPTYQEWQTLIRRWNYTKDENGNLVEPDKPYRGAGLAYAGRQLRAKDDTWAYKETNTNSSGFSALPGGWLWKGRFNYLGGRSAWWAPNRGNPSCAKIARGDQGTWMSAASKNDLMYIRCIKE